MTMNIVAVLLSIIYPFFAFGGLYDALYHQDVKNHITNNVFRYQLAAVVIFRDEAPYLKEWIEYHRQLGVEHFYLYNNLSQDGFREVLEPYIKEGTVELIDWPYESEGIPSWNAVQCLAYRQAVNKAVTDRVKWLAILDSDEFVVPRHVDSLQTFLKGYENDTIGSIRVHWVMFGTSYVDKVPDDKLMIETLVMNEGYVDGMWKSIVRPNRVDPYELGGPHTQKMMPGYEMPLVSTEEIQCNHYWTRDEYYLQTFKIPQRILWGTPAESCNNWKDSFNHTNDASLPILRFVPELRRRMNLK